MSYRIDHIAITVDDIQATGRFYKRVLGMEICSFGGSRKALRFGQQKINVHQKGKESSPRHGSRHQGSADLCSQPILRWLQCSNTWNNRALKSWRGR